MTKNKFQNALTFKFDYILHSQKCGGEKITQPNMAPSIQQMVEASNRGLTVKIDQTLQYFENEDDSLIDVKDLTDLDLMKLSLKETEKKQKDYETKKAQKQKESVTNSNPGQKKDEAQRKDDIVQDENLT